MMVTAPIWRDGVETKGNLAEFVTQLRQFADMVDEETCVRSDPMALAGDRLRAAASVIEAMKVERLALDKRIHNQRVALRSNWEIIEMRAEYKRAWYPSKLLLGLLRRSGFERQT
jgi:hypothetical protein